MVNKPKKYYLDGSEILRQVIGSLSQFWNILEYFLEDGLVATVSFNGMTSNEQVESKSRNTQIPVMGGGYHVPYLAFLSCLHSSNLT